MRARAIALRVAAWIAIPIAPVAWFVGAVYACVYWSGHSGASYMRDVISDREMDRMGMGR